MFDSLVLKAYTIVGHSLGAGCAALLGMVLKNEHNVADVKVYAYGCPPVTDFKTAIGGVEYITSVVNNRDVIPRVSLSNMRIMNKTVAMMKDLMERGCTLESIESNDKNEDKDKLVIPEGDVINTKDMDPASIGSADLVEIMRETSSRYKLRYEEDLYIPGTFTR